MALFDDLFSGGNWVTGLAIGLGAVIVLPLAAPVLRPLAKTAIKGGILAYRGAAGLGPSHRPYLLWRGKRMPARMPHLRGASGAARVCGNMEHRARLSRNPRKNLLLSVNYLTLLDRFLNDAA
jgi:hypothetical protein